jgi:hypothetical protein
MVMAIIFIESLFPAETTTKFREHAKAVLVQNYVSKIYIRQY